MITPNDRLLEPRYVTKGTFELSLRILTVGRHHGVRHRRTCLGHTGTTGPAATTDLKATFNEGATDLAAMTGQPHFARPPVNDSDIRDQRTGPGAVRTAPWPGRSLAPALDWNSVRREQHPLWAHVC